MNGVQIGVSLPQFTEEADRFLNSARRAEELGFDSLWVFDHLWPLSGGKERPVLEAWTSLAALAAITSSATVGTLVTRSSLRHPALLAKMAATVGGIAPGRVIVAIGSGDHLSRAENEAFGIDYYEADDRIEQYSETVETVYRFLTEDTLTLQGEFVRLDDLPTSPRPKPRPRVWAAGRSDDVLDVAARLADGWNAWGGTPERFAQDAQNLLEMAEPRELELSWATTVVLGRDDDDAASKLGARDPSKLVIGGPRTVTERLQEMVSAGARHLIVSLTDPSSEGSYERLAEEVVPALRAG